MSVPFTMQTFAVFAVAGLLGFKRGSAAVAVYILLGAVGVPVFSGFRGGPDVLLGQTGGYIVGFLFSAMITGFAADRFGRSAVVLAASMLAGLAACYTFGTLWFMYVYTRNTGSIGFASVLMTCVVPFIIPDIVKTALAVFVVKRAGKIIH
ncbi:MAG: biotin transporter BioY [Clostridia bacterium]|nr:biotin transporter BioY [Clostridia bacterium]